MVNSFLLRKRRQQSLLQWAEGGSEGGRKIERFGKEVFSDMRGRYGWRFERKNMHRCGKKKYGGLMKQKAEPSQKRQGRCNKGVQIRSEERKRQDKDRKTTKRGGKRGVGRWLKSCIITALTHMSKRTRTLTHTRNTHASLRHLTTHYCSIWHV